MIGFAIAVVLLLMTGAALLLSRRSLSPRAADHDDPNLGWYRQRRVELQGADQALVDEAQLRLLEDGGASSSVSGHEDSLRSPQHFPAGLLVLAISVVCVGIYWKTGALEDVLIYDALISISPDAGDAKREALLRRIESRSLARQENLQYLSLLGRLHMAGENYAQASENYARLAEKTPGDPQALALAAQASFLAAGRQLDSDAQLLAEQALAVDPMQRTALGLLGMASFEAGAYNAAVTYWGRLQTLESPDSPGYQMLGEVLAMARERAGTGAVAATAEAVADEPGISVELSLLASSSVDPAATVFVFARSAASDRGMPVAVRRLQASQLPITFRLSDGDAMAGQLLSQAGEVRVSAQLSANGQPGVANAVMSGVSDPVSAVDGDASVRIELRPSQERG